MKNNAAEPKDIYLQHAKNLAHTHRESGEEMEHYLEMAVQRGASEKECDDIRELSW